MTDDLAERLAFVVGAVNRRLRPRGDALSHVALSALASVQAAGTIRPGDLARTEGIAASGMTRLIADLDHQGLVTRAADPEDGRSQRIGISSAGHAALERARSARAADVEALLGTLGAADRAAVLRTVALLESALLAATPGPAEALPTASR